MKDHHNEYYWILLVNTTQMHNIELRPLVLLHEYMCRFQFGPFNLDISANKPTYTCTYNERPLGLHSTMQMYVTSTCTCVALCRGAARISKGLGLKYIALYQTSLCIRYDVSIAENVSDNKRGRYVY